MCKLIRCWRWEVILVAVLLVGMASSCNKTLTREDVERYQLNLFSAYYTNNFQVAKSVLDKDLQNLSEWQSNHVEGTDFNIDYDACRAWDHGWLFLLYWKTDDTNEMKNEFQQRMELLENSSRIQNVPPPPSMTYDDFAKLLELREQFIANKLKLKAGIN